MEEEDIEERRERRRRARTRQGDVSYQGTDNPPVPVAQNSYGYDPRFSQGADYREAQNNPGPEPPRDSPEWPAWKAHAKAWRRQIGERQQWVDSMVGQGYSLEDLGIRDVHEEGQAGYRRRSMGPGGLQGYYDRTRAGNAGAFANVMGEGGPENGIRMNSYGIYEDPRPDGSIQYWDSLGNKTDAQGNRTGGNYYQPQRSAASIMPTQMTGSPARTFGNPGGVQQTSQTSSRPTAQHGGGLLAPTNSFAEGEPTPGSSYDRPMRKVDLGQGYGSWGSFYGANRPTAGGRTSIRRFI